MDHHRRVLQQGIEAASVAGSKRLGRTFAACYKLFERIRSEFVEDEKESAGHTHDAERVGDKLAAMVSVSPGGEGAVHGQDPGPE